jgi:hypothetical protein
MDYCRVQKQRIREAAAQSTSLRDIAFIHGLKVGDGDDNSCIWTLNAAFKHFESARLRACQFRLRKVLDEESKTREKGGETSLDVHFERGVSHSPQVC